MEPVSRKERIAALPEGLQARLHDRLVGRAARSTSIPRTPRNQDLPLSLSQGRLWFLDQLDPGGAEYVTAKALRLTGPIDRNALRTAARRLVARHETLRTTFDSTDGRGIQVVHPPDESATEFRDLSSSAAPEDELDTVLATALARPFDLHTGPLFRILLIRLAQDAHVLVLVAHHIVVDGWSLSVLVDELGALYAEALDGTAPDLSESPLQYADFAVWQRDRLSGGVTDRHLDHWRENLADVPVLDLPTDRPRPSVRSSAGATVDVPIPPKVLERLADLARDNATTLFSVLVSAGQVLLARYARQDDVAVGTTTSGRSLPELERAVGFFANTVVLRSRVDPHQPFPDFLRSVTETVDRAFTHEEVAFDRLVDTLAPERDPSRTPLFQAMVVLHNAPPGVPSLTGVRAEPMELPLSTASVDLAFDFYPTDDGLVARLNYSTDLFVPETMHRLAGYLGELLRGIADDPDRPVRDLPWLPSGERQELLVKRNETALGYRSDLLIHHLFEEQARRWPDRTAVIAGQERLTFAELDARANRLAHHLMALGVRPGVLVGLCVERGLDAVVGILGVVKAGGAYVPLAPEYPAERLAYMATDAEVPVMVVQEHLLDRLPTLPDVRLVRIDRDWPDIAERAATAPETTIRPEDLAYVVYTSGTTGHPKGVMVEHRNLAYIAAAWDHLYGLSEAPLTFVSVTSLSVDLFFSDLLRSAFFGGTFIVAPSAAVTDPAELLDLIDWVGGNAIELVPGLADALVREAATRGPVLPGLRLLSVGSEAWRTDECRDLVRRLDPATIVVNAYGATEVTVDSCVFFPAERPLRERRFVPIGTPIPNTRVYVVDTALRPVPTGVAGELLVGGDGVARGYWKRQALTAERFIDDPFTGTGRLYRTGDLVRWTHEGGLDFLGRVDDQVKIRGFRVEPAEVEAALARHPDLAEVAVSAPEDDTGVRQLVAYVVSVAGRAPGASELRAFLRQTRPEHMVPSRVVVLDALPRTPNGKVDRRSLPALPAPTADMEQVEPRTVGERELAEIWAKALSLDQVGVETDFFELGGDSITSIQVVSQAKRAGLNLSIRDIFTHRTVSALAAHVEQSGTVEHSAPGEADDVGPTLRPAPLTPIQRWFFDTYQVRPDSYTMSVLFELAADARPDVLDAALRGVVDHHDALRMRFTTDGDGERRQVTAMTDADLLWRRDVSGIDTDKAEAVVRHAAEQAQLSLDTAEGPLLRAVFVHRGRNRAPWLFIGVHHLVIDGVSWRILLEDLESAYEQLSRGESVRLGPKSTPFAEWAHNLDEHVRAGGLDADLSHWREVFSDGHARLPRDRDGDNTARSAQSVVLELDEATTSSILHELPRRYGTQVNDILLSALARTLTEWTGRSRIVVGMEGHGREDLFDGLDLSRTVGWFTTHFPVAFDLSGAISWGDVIASTRRRLGALPARGLSYDALRFLAPEGAPADAIRRERLPDISFNYLGRFDVADPGGLYRDRKDMVGSGLHPDQPRPYVLDSVGLVESGRLRFTWTYSADLHDESTIRRIGAEFFQALRDIVDDHGEPTSEAPLTFGQQRLWFEHQVEPQGTSYNDSIGLRLYGPIDRDSLRAALVGLSARHEALRTTYHERHGHSVQRVCAPETPPLEITDLVGERDTDAELDRILRAAVARPFDLARGPLWRAVLVRLSPDEHVLALIIHHIAADGWSLGVIISELSALYSGEVDGTGTALPELALTYREHAVWQRERLAGDLWEDQLTYWRGQLADVPVLDLPTDRPRPAVQTRNGTHLSFRIPAGTTGDLRKLGNDSGATLYMTLLAACQLLLSRYSGQRDVAVGTGVSGRDRAELEHLVGFFVNTLVVRTQVDDRLGFGEYLRHVRDTSLDAFTHADVPFEVLVNELSLERDPSRPLLFQALVLLQNLPNAVLELSGLRAEQFGLPTSTTNIDLSFQFWEADGGLHGMIGYNTDLFDGSTIERMAERLTQLLERVVAEPHRPMAQLAWFTDAERQSVMEDFNRTAVPRPDACVHELIAEWAQRTPDAVAVTDGTWTLGYAELDARVNRFANFLADRGVGAEDLVAIHLERDLDLVIAVLGIHKAGGAFVSLEPEQPSERLFSMIGDTAHTVVTRERFRDRVVGFSGEMICLDEVREDIAGTSDAPPQITVRPAQLAYLTCTSGSTGAPKGVLIEHRALRNSILAVNEQYLLGPEDRVLQFNPMSFDGGVWELFTTLSSGATLCLSRAVSADKELDLTEQVSVDGVTVLSVTPGMARMLDRTACSGLRVLGVAGDVCPPDVVAEWSRGHDVFNVYGPSECALVATLFKPEPGALHGVVPIGAPIANVRCYVLDRTLRPVPVDVPGDLYIAGAGVGRGYLHRPDMTAERYVADPHGAPGDRMYCTGDVARWRPSGVLEFIARADDQLKIRGYRVEPGEVETVLLRHPEVLEAVVGAWSGEDGHKRLVAHATAMPGREPRTRELRQFMAESLPQYMVPSGFVLMDRLPLRPNGKVDRQALQAPDITSGTGVPHRPPETGVERALAGIWAEVLGTEHVGLDDNFFELGGDSILTIQVVSRARRAGVRLLTRHMLIHQTVAELAAVAEVEAAGDQPDAGPTAGPVPLTPVQSWFFATHTVAPSHFSQSMLVELRDGISEDALRAVLEALVRQHDALRMRYEFGDGSWRQHNAAHEGREILFRRDVSYLAEEDLHAALDPMAEEIQSSIDLSTGPLVRAVLFDTSPGIRARLLLTIHHLVVDSVSWRILLDDLETAYQQAVAGRPIELGARTTSFKTWAERLTAHVAEGGLDDEVDYWLNATQNHSLPTDLEGENTVASTRTVRVPVSTADTEILLQRAPGVFRTRVNEVLLSAVAWALARWTGQSATPILVESHGRTQMWDDIDLSRTVGWFTSAYPIALDVLASGEPDWASLVKSVRRQLRAVPDEGIGYLALRRLSPPDGPGVALAHRTEPQVVFNYHGQWDASGAAPGSDGDGDALCLALHSGIGQNQSPDEKESHLIEITGSAYQGQLSFSWNYSENIFLPQTVHTVAEHFSTALRGISAYCADSVKEQDRS